MAQNYSTQQLYDSYDNYKERSIDDKRFNHDTLKAYLEKYKIHDLYEMETVGESMDGREIYMFKFGNGPTKIFTWSQMHGDESTATMALLDLLKFFERDDQFNEIRKNILEKTTIYVVPMLNPDGAERYDRRNALDIDLNRDALRLQAPESRILKGLRDSLKPQFGFNLHDQATRYTSGYTHRCASIAFLAPAYNVAKDINDVRGNTMKVIVNMHDELSRYIPGHIAKYDDEFEPRAFGDNFMKWGTSSVLIESGGWKNNYEKQFIRKLNFLGLLVGYQSIANGYYENADLATYNNIPENKKRLFDLLLRNLTVEYKGKDYVVDLGINQVETPTSNNRDDYFRGVIDDIGDLSTFYGYDEVDCTGLTVSPGKISEVEYSSIDEIKELDFFELYEKGVTHVKLNDINQNKKFTYLPINVILNGKKVDNAINVGKTANLVIREGEKIRFVIVNGFLIDLVSKKTTLQNTLIFR